MKAKLDADVTIKKITIFTDAKINSEDKSTHLVEVEGYVSHVYLWEKEKQQTFKFDLCADEELCKAIQTLIEKSLAKDVQNFPRDL